MKLKGCRTTITKYGTPREPTTEAALKMSHPEVCARGGPLGERQMFEISVCCELRTCAGLGLGGGLVGRAICLLELAGQTVTWLLDVGLYTWLVGKCLSSA